VKLVDEVQKFSYTERSTVKDLLTDAARKSTNRTNQLLLFQVSPDGYDLIPVGEHEMLANLAEKQLRVEPHISSMITVALVQSRDSPHPTGQIFHCPISSQTKPLLDFKREVSTYLNKKIRDFGARQRKNRLDWTNKAVDDHNFVAVLL
jgi:hypothetical protein